MWQFYSTSTLEFYVAIATPIHNTNGKCEIKLHIVMTNVKQWLRDGWVANVVKGAVTYVCTTLVWRYA